MSLKFWVGVTDHDWFEHLHATGTMDGKDWLMTRSTQKDHMLLEEQQIRGKVMNTRRQFSDWMSRPKP